MKRNETGILLLHPAPLSPFCPAYKHLSQNATILARSSWGIPYPKDVAICLMQGKNKPLLSSRHSFPALIPTGTASQGNLDDGIPEGSTSSKIYEQAEKVHTHFDREVCQKHNHTDTLLTSKGAGDRHSHRKPASEFHINCNWRALHLPENPACKARERGIPDHPYTPQPPPPPWTTTTA